MCAAAHKSQPMNRPDISTNKRHLIIAKYHLQYKIVFLILLLSVQGLLYAQQKKEISHYLFRSLSRGWC